MLTTLPPIAQLALAIGLILLSRSRKFYDIIVKNQGDLKAIKMMKLTKYTGYLLLFTFILVNGIALLFLYRK